MRPTVFLSQPSMLTVDQQSASDDWRRALEDLGFAVDRLSRSDYQLDPWRQLRDVIGCSDGLLVLGFRQLEVRAGTWRAGTPEAKLVSAAWTSTWLHAEVGMALMAELPVLAVPEAGVVEGVFSPDAWSGNCFGVRAWQVDQAAQVGAWAAAVRQRWHSNTDLRRVS